MKYNILVVDDEIDNLQLFIRTFRKKYNVLIANSGYEAIEILKNNHIDLIISDHKMPEMDGVEFLTRSLSINPDTIRILLTAYTDASSLISAINNAKIYRYVKKPWNINDLSNIVDSALEVYQLNFDNQELAVNLKDLFSGTIAAITNALDAKDSFTFGRSKRVTYYALKAGKHLGLSDAELSELELAGLLHDIGMIGVPESIINKPGTLSQEEYNSIKEHVTYGVKILEEIKQLESVISSIKSHHERYDGTGYPHGLKGDQIPIGAKIIAVADTYDAMTSDRAYRKGLTHEVAVAEIQIGAGTQFDPDIINAFVAVIDSALEDIKRMELASEELQGI
ncbi:MAG: response regulator receiver modulated metal dependent phosphohydrolase [uncultured bacterium]|nr:MAG: response regulator receiver modulated metal dependent phosphohydrolase [uncultured bacterium]